MDMLFSSEEHHNKVLCCTRRNQVPQRSRIQIWIWLNFDDHLLFLKTASFSPSPVETSAK